MGICAFRIFLIALILSAIEENYNRNRIVLAAFAVLGQRYKSRRRKMRGLFFNKVKNFVFFDNSLYNSGRKEEEK